MYVFSFFFDLNLFFKEKPLNLLKNPTWAA
jgi:hypothetical protein